MIQFIVTVLDSKAECFEPPYYARTEQEAERIFSDAINDPQSRVGKHPEDYQIFMLGTFDTQTGSIDLFDDLKLLGSGSKYIASE